MKRVALFMSLLLTLTVCWSLEARAGGLSAFEGLSGELRVVGSDVGLAPARLAAEAIMAANPRVKITFTLTGPGTGLSRLRQRQADISLHDREPTEVSPASAAVLDFIPWGVDPVAVVVNPRNGIDSLSVDQLRRLFGHSIKLWSELGGADLLVMPTYMEASEVEGKPDIRSGNISATFQPSMRHMLSRGKEVLAYMSMRDLYAMVKPVAVDGVLPERQAFRSGKYRIYRVMYLALGREPSPLVRAFAAYLTGQAGQDLLEKTGYEPLAAKPAWESALPVGQPNRMAEGS